MTYDESGRAARCRVVTALLAVALIVLVGANLCIGSVLVPADHIPGILSGGAANSHGKPRSSGRFACRA